MAHAKTKSHDRPTAPARPLGEHLFLTEVTQPVLIKDQGLFLVSRPDGSIGEGKDGEGLHYHDTRYLSRYRLWIGGHPPMTLMASSARASEAILQFSNYETDDGEGRRLPLQSLKAELRRSLDGRDLRLLDELTIESYAADCVRFSIELEIDAWFEDLFELRGAKPKRRGQLRRTHTAETAAFEYQGADKVLRELHVAFSPAPSRITGKDGEPVRVVFELALAQRGTASISVSFRPPSAGS